MKLKKGFILRDVAGEWVVVNVDGDLDLNGMITLNDTGKTLWCCLENETDIPALAQALMAEYEVDEPKALECAERFVETVRGYGFLDE